MSELFYEEFKKRKKKAKELPIVKLELTMGNLLLRKYDIIKIGEQCFLCSEGPLKTEEGFQYGLIALSNDDTCLLDEPVTLLDTILPEL